MAAIEVLGEQNPGNYVIFKAEGCWSILLKEGPDFQAIDLASLA